MARIVGLGVVAIAIAFGLARALLDPDVPLLVSRGGAEWIVYDRAPSLKRYAPESLQTRFRLRFAATRHVADATLVVRAFREASVRLDGDERPPLAASLPPTWKTDRLYALGPIAPGAHELLITVRNRNAPPALLAHSRALGIASGAHWDAALAHAEWKPARTAAHRRVPKLAERFPSAARGLRAHLGLLAGLAAVALAVGFLRRDFHLRPAHVRWALVGAWCALAANNYWKLPLDVGFDVDSHAEYARYIAEHWRVPLASQGWQMFQAPFYYLLSAPLLALGDAFGAETAARLLRVIPLACGIAQVELCYRAARAVFPERDDLQSAAAIVGGLLPINLYTSQVAGNEPLAGVLTAAAVCVALRFARHAASEETRIPAAWDWSLGALLGLAVLTKTTAALFVPVALGAMAVACGRDGVRRWALGAARVLGVVLLVAGWYYARNVFEFGKPFVGGWDPAREIVWWQEPGVRTPGDFVRFGASLVQPVFAAVHGFWDALYSTLWLDGYLSGRVSWEGRPPWNYGLVAGSAWLALFPALCILGGGVSALGGRARNGVRLAAAALALYVAALGWLYLTLPVYTTAKASYTLGLLPCYGLLAAAGLEAPLRHKIARPFLWALLLCWAVFAYAGYLVA